jgi:(1->4)-alpha-D-glucan 1-alpha-D-glucosylmutase
MTTTDLISQVLARANREALARRRLPGATYRLQLHHGFTFRQAEALTSYLHDLGISHCYTSPFLQARPGSAHGYDIINHQRLNREIGTCEDFDSWVEALHDRDMGLVLDTVPNHMAVATNDNPWWNDVLENGPGSPWAGYFDIAWHASSRPELMDRVLVPVLGDPYGKVLESGQLRLDFSEGAFVIWYFDRRLPVAPRTYSLIMRHRQEQLEKLLATEPLALAEYQSILTAVEHLPLRSETDPAKVAEQQREKEVIKRRLAALTQDQAGVRAFVEETVRVYNGQPGQPRSFGLLDKLLDEQPYRLSYWRVAADEINYRRFFDINDLAALSMERPEIFEATHVVIMDLLRQGKLNGLRVDHVDGLFDPRQYLERLQERYILELARDALTAEAGSTGAEWKEAEGPLLEEIRAARRQPDHPLARPLYVVVEKILGPEEPLPEAWSIHGTSGYHFLNMVNGLFVQTAHARDFTRLYQAWTGDDTPYADIVYRMKFLILQTSLSSELHMLAYQLDRLAQKNRWSRDFTLHTLRHALREIIACFPVYRSYIGAEGMRDADRRYVEYAARRAMLKNPAINRSVFLFVRDMLLQHYPDSATEEDRQEQLRFAGKFQQVTAPVMAKGLEDSAFYAYNRLASLNEVGGDPERFGLSPEALHRYFEQRQARWPWALSPLSTHDTKRSEDVRARINVLSELPLEWEQRLATWGRLNAAHRRQVEDLIAPDPNEEYLIYQTLLGAWPLGTMTSQARAGFVGRIQAYVQKALYEAKVHTSWVNPNPEYSQAVADFVHSILDETVSGEFLANLLAFQKRISHYGLFNSLSQTLLRLTAPGVPDTYQGTELWDFSLVDPDNRRPVDYAERRRLLEELGQRLKGPDGRDLARELTVARQDGRIKLYVTRQALHERRQRPALFAEGDYLPLRAAGPGTEHIFAFLRRQSSTWALVAVPRLLASFVPSMKTLPLGTEVWRDTSLLLPGMNPDLRFHNRFTGEKLALRNRQGQVFLSVADMLTHFPVALCIADAEKAH